MNVDKKQHYKKDTQSYCLLDAGQRKRDKWDDIRGNIAHDIGVALDKVLDLCRARGDGAAHRSEVEQREYQACCPYTAEQQNCPERPHSPEQDTEDQHQWEIRTE